MPHAPLDQMSRRILAAVATDFLDADALARHLGASPAVVRGRLAALQEAGVLRGLHARLDPAAFGPACEVLASGVATAQTDRAAIDRLCGTAGVTRVFGMAARHSVAFTVRGASPDEAQGRALELAKGAGLMQAQAVLIVNTFHDGPAWTPPQA